MQLTDLRWPDIDALSRDTPVVFPVAALEQHGRHMPLFTDSLLLGEVVRRVSERLADRALFALVWLGNSEHHLDFPGTMSAAPRTFLDVLGDLLENFLRHGFRRLLILNGHGGNDVPGKQAVFEVRQRHRDRPDLLLLFGTYWLLGRRAAREISADFVQDRMGHACEWETSMMLRLAPHLVGDYQHVVEVPFGNPFEPASRGWITKDRSEPGHIGAPAHASREKGEALFATFAGDVTAMIERMLAWDGRSWNG